MGLFVWVLLLTIGGNDNYLGVYRTQQYCEIIMAGLKIEKPARVLRCEKQEVRG
jgi:hypothetical protein